MWKGRFAQETSRLVQAYGESVSFDWRLFAHDIRGSIAHSQGLLKAGILTADEVIQLQDLILQVEVQLAPEKAAEVYLASVIVCDHTSTMERAYLDALATALRLPPDLKAELERRAAAGG